MCKGTSAPSMLRRKRQRRCNRSPKCGRSRDRNYENPHKQRIGERAPESNLEVTDLRLRAISQIISTISKYLRGHKRAKLTHHRNSFRIALLIAAPVSM